MVVNERTSRQTDPIAASGRRRTTPRRPRDRITYRGLTRPAIPFAA